MAVDEGKQQFTVRHFDPVADFPRLLRFLTLVEALERTGEDVSEEALREQMTRPGHNPMADRWVAEAPDAPGEIIGFGALWKTPEVAQAPIFIAVHPRWRGHRLGARLLHLCVARARDLEAQTLFAYAADHQQAVKDFWIREGFQQDGVYTEMRAERPKLVIDTHVPSGYRVVTFAQLGELDTLVEATNRSYQGQWGHRELTAREMAQWLPSLPADGIFLAFGPEGDVAGVCRVEVREQQSDPDAPLAYILSPGLVAAHRSPELRRALLRSAMSFLQDHGHRSMGLESWGDNEEALAVYREEGFMPVTRAIAYHLDLP